MTISVHSKRITMLPAKVRILPHAPKLQDNFIKMIRIFASNAHAILTLFHLICRQSIVKRPLCLATPVPLSLSTDIANATASRDCRTYQNNCII